VRGGACVSVEWGVSACQLGGATDVLTTERSVGREIAAAVVEQECVRLALGPLVVKVRLGPVQSPPTAPLISGPLEPHRTNAFLAVEKRSPHSRHGVREADDALCTAQALATLPPVFTEPRTCAV
jgi:hypothetical protein